MVNIQEHPGIARVLATGSPYPRRVRENVDEDALYEERRERMLFPDKGGSPCDSCWRQSVCDNGCELWEREYLRRQKQINAYAKALWHGTAPSQAKIKDFCQLPQRGSQGDVFAYSHPDLVRRYEKTHPCHGCGLEKGCKMPCGRYLHWYDCRMELARKRAVLN